MFGVTIIFLVLGLVPAVLGNLGTYTSFVNLEKLYTLEDELITITDVLLKHEVQLHGEEDVHGFNNISR